MTKSRYLLLCAAVLLATLAVTLAVYQRLPDQIPMHWNIHGTADHFGPRGAIFAHTIIMLVFMLVAGVLPSVSPGNFKVEPFSSTYWYVCLAIVSMLGYIQMVMVWGALSPSLDLSRMMFGGILVFLLVIGNVVGKLKPNFWMGIRTPWTLADPRVWYATHRLAGKTIVGASALGLVVLLAGLPVEIAAGLMIAGPVFPALYSLVYFKRFERSDKA